MKNIFKYMFAVIIIAVCAVVNVNAQSSDSILVNKYEYGALKLSNDASRTNKRSCYARHNNGAVTNCGGVYGRIGAGMSFLNWKNDAGQTGDESHVQYTGILGYRFMHMPLGKDGQYHAWICALRPEIRVTVNPSTTVEGLSNETSIGIGGAMLFEFFPHEAVRVAIGPALQTRNLTAFDAIKNQKYDGNVFLMGGEVNVDIPLGTVFNRHNGGNIEGNEIFLDLGASYMFGTTHKEWDGTNRKVDFKELAIHATLGIRF